MTKLLYFAWLREIIGIGEEQIVIPEHLHTVGDLITWLQARGDHYAAAFARPELVRCAVEQDFAKIDAPIAGAAEIAFFPPVTGG